MSQLAPPNVVGALQKAKLPFEILALVVQDCVDQHNQIVEERTAIMLEARRVGRPELDLPPPVPIIYILQSCTALRDFALPLLYKSITFPTYSSYLSLLRHATVSNIKTTDKMVVAYPARGVDSQEELDIITGSPWLCGKRPANLPPSCDNAPDMIRISQVTLRPNCVFPCAVGVIFDVDQIFMDGPCTMGILAPDKYSTLSPRLNWVTFRDVLTLLVFSVRSSSGFASVGEIHLRISEEELNRYREMDNRRPGQFDSPFRLAIASTSILANIKSFRFTMDHLPHAFCRRMDLDKKDKDGQWEALSPKIRVSRACEGYCAKEDDEHERSTRQLLDLPLYKSDETSWDRA